MPVKTAPALTVMLPPPRAPNVVSLVFAVFDWAACVTVVVADSGCVASPAIVASVEKRPLDDPP